MEETQTLSQRITEVRSQEKLIHSISKELDSIRWTDFYFVVYSTEPNQPTFHSLYGGDSEGEEFNICCDKYRDGKVAQKCRSLKLFDIGDFNMKNIEKSIKHFHTFLNSSFPDSVHNLNVYCMHVIKLIKFDIFKSVIKCSSKICTSACFDQFSFGKSQFKRLIAAFRHVHKLTFRRCNLSIPNPLDLSTALRNTKMEKLSFYLSGSLNCSNWEANPNDFKHLVHGLGTSEDLAQTLRVIDFRNCGLERGYVKELLTQSGLGSKTFLV
ncbi:unnamed protein product [Moneuplotes crassus]|uniref:Uncharacterized protein n=1 Tax=Euplotes crassus TaxID=5936 RepID=A0AAD1UP93_EUPCR|nr:unnamed protein product [Moneuplotes crassus]